MGGGAWPKWVMQRSCPFFGDLRDPDLDLTVIESSAREEKRFFSCAQARVQDKEYKQTDDVDADGRKDPDRKSLRRRQFYRVVIVLFRYHDPFFCLISDSWLIDIQEVRQSNRGRPADFLVRGREIPGLGTGMRRSMGVFQFDKSRGMIREVGPRT